MPEIDLQSAITTNVLRLGELTLEAHADRIVVVEDEFRSGYECATCGGTGNIKCADCTDGTSAVNPLIKCKSCAGTTWILCADCGGKGALLVIPEQSARRPTTGTIVSVGPDVTRLTRGQSVIYPSFCGHVFDLNAVDLSGTEIQVCIRIMRESEVIAKVSGHLDLRRVQKSVAMVGG
jgi:co-chaperonin GroES (HSP10)